MTGPKKPSAPRAERRAAQRSSDKLARQRERLWALEPGGSPGRPLEVPSASLVESRALALPCLRCGAAEARLDEHAAASAGGHILRTLRTHCGRCGAPRTLYLRVVPAGPNLAPRPAGAVRRATEVLTGRAFRP
ncbi:MAG TPA: hypothetical protein VFS43_37230 [Polyangiaceae bacterium]|nr:hypothetical protein [Polyangiaceae bacterium]